MPAPRKASLRELKERLNNSNAYLESKIRLMWGGGYHPKCTFCYDQLPQTKTEIVTSRDALYSKNFVAFVRGRLDTRYGTFYDALEDVCPQIDAEIYFICENCRKLCPILNESETSLYGMYAHPIDRTSTSIFASPSWMITKRLFDFADNNRNSFVNVCKDFSEFKSGFRIFLSEDGTNALSNYRETGIPYFDSICEFLWNYREPDFYRTDKTDRAVRWITLRPGNETQMVYHYINTSPLDWDVRFPSIPYYETLDDRTVSDFHLGNFLRLGKEEPYSVVRLIGRYFGRVLFKRRDQKWDVRFPFEVIAR